jgi:hypothetical protein
MLASLAQLNIKTTAFGPLSRRLIPCSVLHDQLFKKPVTEHELYDVQGKLTAFLEPRFRIWDNSPKVKLDFTTP